MFDIGFWELTLIAVVALVVIGPERMPEVARKAGMWVGRIRRFVTNVKDDIDRELRQEELRKALERDAGLDEIKKIMDTDAFVLEEEDQPKPTATAPASSAESENETDPVALAERLQAGETQTQDHDAKEEGLDNEAGHADLAETPFESTPPPTEAAVTDDSTSPKDDERKPS